MNRSPHIATALMLAGLCGSTIACASPGDPDVVLVRITPTGFDPATVKVASGTELRWSNETTTPHTVDATGVTLAEGRVLPPGPAPFSSPPLRQGETFSRVMDVEGLHLYGSGLAPDESLIGVVEVSR